MTNELKQTAIEWLLQKIEEKNGKEFSSFYSEFIDEAIEKEKEEIVDAYDYGSLRSGCEEGEEYYNDTFNK